MFYCLHCHISRVLFRFRSGNYSTKFIGNEYPEGFHGVKLTKPETSQFIALAAAIHSARNEDVSAAAHQHSYGTAERQQLKAMQEARQKHHLESTAYVSAEDQEEEGQDEEEDYFSDGETEDMVVVLGGPKGHAYQVSLNVSDLLTVTITPFDKHNKLDNGKTVTVSTIIACADKRNCSPGFPFLYFLCAGPC